MSIITRMLKDTAVYWPPGSEASGGQDFDDDGDPQYASPVEVECRWEEKAVEFINANGATVVSRAVVYVNVDMRPGGVLWHGTLANVSDLSVPKNNEDAWEVQQFEKLPNLKYTEYLRTAYL